MKNTMRMVFASVLAAVGLTAFDAGAEGLHAVKWLESTGDQWIDTEINADGKLSVELKCQYVMRAGLRVPADIGLAGFDDIQLAAPMTPPLTTIHQPCNEIGAVAYETLIGRILNPALPVREICLSAPLVVRESVQRASKRDTKNSKKTTKEDKP